MAGSSILRLAIDYIEQSIESTRHEYLLVVTAMNTGPSDLNPTHADLEIPTLVVLDDTGGSTRVESRDTNSHSFFRNDQIGPIHPGDETRLFQQGYCMTHDLYDQRASLFPLVVRVTVYGVSDEPLVVEKEFRDLQVF